MVTEYFKCVVSLQNMHTLLGLHATAFESLLSYAFSIGVKINDLG